MADPATMAALAGLGSSIIGTKQLGAAAPAFNPQGGGLLGVAGDDEDEQLALLQSFMQAQGATPARDPAPLSGLVQGATGTDAGPQSPSMSDIAAEGNFGADVQEPQSKGIMGLLDGAFGNLDQNLQRPSVGLGLGLLSSIDPRLAQGGLLASALFGRNKLFGG